MNCSEFSRFYSAQVDGQADEGQQRAAQTHLRGCARCRRSAADLRGLRAELRTLEVPRAAKTKTDLTASVQALLRAEARSQAQEAARRTRWFDWLEVGRVRLYSQGIGAAVSLCLLLVVLVSVLRPAYRTLALAQAATQVIFEDPADEIMRNQALLKTALLAPAAPPPMLNPNEAFRDAAATVPADEDVILMAEVHKGASTTLLFVQAPSDPALTAKLSTAMSQRGIFAGYHPGATSNTITPAAPVAPVAIVVLSSMTIHGSASI